MKDYILAATSVVGIVLTAVFALLTNRQKFREDLQGKYDANIHQQRTEVYLPLWKKLEVLARFAPPEPVTTKGILDLSESLRKWFFDTGGLFLSDDSRHAYLDLQQTIVTHVREHTTATEELDQQSLRKIQDKASVLRAHLSKDVGSRKSVSIRF